MVEKRGAVGQEGGSDAAFCHGGAEKLVEGNQKVGVPNRMFRTEEQVLVGLNRASIAAAAVGGVTVVVAKKSTSSGKKVVDPFGNDDASVGVETADGRAVSWPVNRLPEAVGPLILVLEMSA